MFIVDFFKTMSAVKKAKKFVKAHEETINTVKEIITWFENHKDDIEAKIADAKATVEKLKGIINK